MSLFSELECRTCGRVKYIVHFSPNFENFLKSFCDLSMLSEISFLSISKAADKVSNEIILRAMEADIAQSYEDIRSEIYSASKIECSNCHAIWDVELQIVISSQIRSSLLKKHHELELKYCSQALNADLSNVYLMLAQANWPKFVTDILDKASPENLTHLKRIRAFIELLVIGEHGAGGVLSLLILTTIASNLASSFLYDVIKGVAKNLPSRMRKLKAKKVVKSTRQELEEKGYNIKSIQQEEYSEDVIAIISSMPKRKREMVINEIALQHTKNIKRQLIASVNRKASAQGKRS